MPEKCPKNAWAPRLVFVANHGENSVFGIFAFDRRIKVLDN
jgi:hypothetical protein